MTGNHHGLGRALDPNHRRGRRHAPQQGTQARWAFRRTQGDVIVGVGHARHLVQDQGRELLDLVGVRDLQPLHRNAYELIQWGKQDVMSAAGLRGARLDAVGVFDAMGALSSRFNF